ALKIADQRPIAMIASTGPVVDTDDARRHRHCRAIAQDGADQGVLTDRHHEPIGKTRGRTPTERQAQMMDEEVETLCPARPGRKHAILQPLGKYLLSAQHAVASKSAGFDEQSDSTTSKREVGGLSPIMTMDTTAAAPTGGANTSRLTRADADLEMTVYLHRRLNDEA